MKGFISGEFLALAASMFLLGGCAFPEHRQAVAAQRDDTRRTEFEHCRTEGRTDCDAILNAPVTSRHCTARALLLIRRNTAVPSAHFKRQRPRHDGFFAIVGLQSTTDI